MMRHLFKITLILTAVIPFLTFAGDRESFEIRAPLILHVLNYTTFPTEDMQGDSDFDMCFLESGDYEHASMLLSPKLQGKKVSDHILNIIKLSDISEVAEQQCQAVFISKDRESSEIYAVLNSLDDDILLIGESSSFVEHGGLLAIVSMQSKMRILVNKDLLESSSLKISSRLLRLAKFI